MNLLLALCAALAVAPVAAANEPPPAGSAPGPTGAPWAPTDPDWQAFRAAAQSARGRIWDRLAELCDVAGHRLAGSPGQVRAERLTAEWLRADGLTVSLDPLKVPVWVRGPASLVLVAPRPEPLALLALGGSVATPAGGVEAPVVVIREFSELGPQVKGKIVLFDHPMRDGLPTIDHYGEAVAFRASGASKAAVHGALAVLVRSVTTRSLYTPHTGGVFYDEKSPRIPAAAIPTEEADRLARMAARGEVRVRLDLQAETRPDADAVNVIGELRGATRPDEIVLLGGHLDSWDVGQGAHDDGAGVVESVEALRLIAARGRPARTVRVVLFANEENGLRGGKAYFAAHGKERHVAAIESDLGGGAPQGWGFTADVAQRAWLTPRLAGSGMYLRDSGGGADISPLNDDGVLSIGLLPDDSHYFDVHHTHADTVDKVDPVALADATAAMAALAWELANAPAAPAKAAARPDR